MLTGKALFAIGMAVVVGLAFAMHFLGSDLLHALGRILHGGQ